MRLQGEIWANDQQIAPFQKRPVDYLASQDKNNGITIIAKSNEEAEHHDYVYAECMAIEGTRPECYQHIIQLVPYLQVEICQMPLARVTSEESIG